MLVHLVGFIEKKFITVRGHINLKFPNLLQILCWVVNLRSNS